MGLIRQICVKMVVIKERRSRLNGDQMRTNGQNDSTVHLVARNNLNDQNWSTGVLLYSNRKTPVYARVVTHQKFQKLGWEVSTQPSHSLDLATSDYVFLLYCKTSLLIYNQHQEIFKIYYNSFSLTWTKTSIKEAL